MIDIDFSNSFVELGNLVEILAGETISIEEFVNLEKLTEGLKIQLQCTMDNLVQVSDWFGDRIGGTTGTIANELVIGREALASIRDLIGANEEAYEKRFIMNLETKKEFTLKAKYEINK